MPDSPTVLVACDDLILLDEVVRHLEEIPQWRLAASARTVENLIAQAPTADCILVSDSLAIELAGHPRRDRLEVSLVVFGRQANVAVFRAALALGARGCIQWPEESGDLRKLVEGGKQSADPGTRPSGSLHAVWSPKGGSGATVIAAHLAGALAQLGMEPLLVDLDLDHADQTCVLGAEAETKTVGDLLRVADELSAQVVQSVQWSHPLGFRAILAPGRVGDTAGASPDGVRRVLAKLREGTEQVVADLPSGVNPVCLAALPEATSISLVLTPDLLALRRARDLLRALGMAAEAGPRITVVLNQAGGTDVGERQVQAVLGLSSVVRVKANLQIYRAANRGELSPLVCKLLTPLARRLSSPEALNGQTPPAKAGLLAGRRPTRPGVARPSQGTASVRREKQAAGHR